jgi:hypothetical protein
MRSPGIRFTLRSLMIALGIAAFVLALEPFFFHYAVELVKSHDEYLWDEAVMVWVILNVLFGTSAAILALFLRAAFTDQV